MAAIVATIQHKTFKDCKSIHTVNPTLIPRIGDKVDMGYSPAATVCDVLWDYSSPAQTNVFIFVN